MPADAPVVKRQATEGYGAQVITYKPGEGDREALAKELQAEHGYTLIPPFNHPQVIAGQGTATKELIETVEALDVVVGA